MPPMAARLLQTRLPMLCAVAGPAGVLLVVAHCKSVACYLVLQDSYSGQLLRVNNGSSL